MRKEFATSWVSSKQPRKQRKYVAKAPLHVKKKFMRANLAKELRDKHKVRTVQLKKGDKVKIMRGKFKGKQGKITEVMLKISKVIIEGIQVKKQDGSKANVKLRPSNLQVVELNMEGSKRKIGKIQTKKTEKKEVKKEEKPVKKVVKKPTKETKK